MAQPKIIKNQYGTFAKYKFGTYRFDPKLDTIRQPTKEDTAWFDETLKRLEAGIEYPECVNHNGYKINTDL